MMTQYVHCTISQKLISYCHLVFYVFVFPSDSVLYKYFYVFSSFDTHSMKQRTSDRGLRNGEQVRSFERYEHIYTHRNSAKRTQIKKGRIQPLLKCATFGVVEKSTRPCNFIYFHDQSGRVEQVYACMFFFMSGIFTIHTPLALICTTPVG